ncbi:MAG: tautomerase CCH2 [Candidatus Pelagadaptatus aseana]|uniref:tautomerase family protein n=1 Tax=Candidatus Pelagadaptatus aseana TaxID=3120508 RepID=UPI0039B31476
MPLYTVSCRKPLSQEIREAVSTTITDTHCEVTDAPPEFVNVVFMDGYSLKNSWNLAVIGGVRSGGNRSAELVEKLQKSLHTNIASASKLPIDKIGIELVGVRASWVMEGGKILPEPGSENDWLQNK